MAEKGQIRFTEHARRQMTQRRIDKESVFLTLSFPDSFEKGHHTNEIIAVKYFDGKRVRVVYASEPDEIRIITVTH